jgi:hypothetical protein
MSAIRIDVRSCGDDDHGCHDHLAGTVMQVGTEKSSKAEVLSPLGWEKSCYFRATLLTRAGFWRS